jgi:hypothetical protein
MSPGLARVVLQIGEIVLAPSRPRDLGPRQHTSNSDLLMHCGTVLPGVGSTCPMRTHGDLHRIDHSTRATYSYSSPSTSRCDTD